MFPAAWHRYSGEMELKPSISQEPNAPSALGAVQESNPALHVAGATDAEDSAGQPAVQTEKTSRALTPEDVGSEEASAPLRRNITESLGEVLATIGSPDGTSRWAGTVFITAIFGMTLSTLLFIRHYRFRQMDSQHQAQREERRERRLKALEHQAEGGLLEPSLAIGSITWANPSRQISDQLYQQNVFIEIALRCADSACSDFVSHHLVETQNALQEILPALSEQDPLSFEGKAKMKRLMVNHFNRWLKKGRLDAIYFTNIVIH